MYLIAFLCATRVGLGQVPVGHRAWQGSSDSKQMQVQFTYGTAYGMATRKSDEAQVLCKLQKISRSLVDALA